MNDEDRNSQVLKEIHDKLDILVNDIGIVKVHLEYMKESRDAMVDNIKNIFTRIGNLEKSRNELVGSIRATKMWGTVFIGIVMIIEAVGIWLALRGKG